MTFLASSAANSGPSMALVVCLGLGMVFVGLICLIAIVYLMGGIMKLLKGKETTPAPALALAPVAAPASATAEITNKQEFIAAVSAVLAEEMGTDVSAIKIVSIKKL